MFGGIVWEREGRKIKTEKRERTGSVFLRIHSLFDLSFMITGAHEQGEHKIVERQWAN